ATTTDANLSIRHSHYSISFRLRNENAPEGTIPRQSVAKGHLGKSPSRSFDGCMTFPVIPSKKMHSTGKPEELMAELLRTANSGGTVLDPFMGPGTTGVAALKAGRKFIGIETSDHYFEVAAQRLRGTITTTISAT
ncbi:TPA: DNA methyltransferase, partial [Escherichia coli]